MAITIFRLDERLIHGQVMTSWIGYTGATEIVVVDDEVAKDDFMKLVLTQAAPKNIKLTVLTCDEFVGYKEKTENKNRIILFKKLNYINRLLDLNVTIPELCLGNMGSSPERKKYTKSIYMTDNERQLLSEIEQKNCQVVIQMLPSDSKKKL